jgi:hypothetical protein
MVITIRNATIVPKSELDPYILTINLYTKLHFSIFNQCEMNGNCWCTDRPTDRKTDSSKEIYPPSSKGAYLQRKWTKTSFKWTFSKSKGYNPVKDGSIVSKRKFDLDYSYNKSVYQISFKSEICEIRASKMNGNMANLYPKQSLTYIVLW